MHITNLDEQTIHDIGHAFGYYDYGTEKGLVSAYSSPDAAADYISGYVRMALHSGMLYTTSERGEGYIAYKLPEQKISTKAGKYLIKALFQSMSPKELARFIKTMLQAGPALNDQMDKEKKPYIFVGMVCVREAYQGQGYMRKLLDMAFAEGNRLGVPVILDTDARSKCDKYIHLGMELSGCRDCGAFGTIYDLVKYPDGDKK